MQLLLIDDSDWLRNYIEAKYSSGIIYCEPKSQILDDYFADDILPNILPTNANNKNNDLIFLINVNLKLKHVWRQSQGGIDILKHIRYTEHDEFHSYSRFAPVILYSFESAQELHRRNERSLFIYSPCVTFLRLPEGLSILNQEGYLDSILKDCRLDDPRKLKPYVHADSSGAVTTLYDHSYRNIAGAPKFILEFTDESVIPNSDQVFTKYNQLRIRDLEFKRLTLLHDELAPGPRPIPGEWAAFRSETNSLRVLYVDDQHQEGWSFGLYAGLRGIKPVGDNFGSGFSVLDSFGAAQQILDDKALAFVTAINGVSAAENALEAANELCRLKQNELSTASNRVNDAERIAEAEKVNLEGAEQFLNISQQDLLSAISSLGESYIILEDHLTGKVPQKEPDLQAAGTAIESIKPSLDAYFSARKKQEERFEEWSRAETSLETLQNEQQAIKNEFAEAQRNGDSRKRELNTIVATINAFPGFDAVFLDLRLDPVADSGRQPDDVSGLHLLSRIKKFCPVLPVIIITASQKATSLKAVQQAGADAYWIKGKDTGPLLREMIEGVIGKKKLIGQWKRLQQITNKPVLICKEAIGIKPDPMGGHLVDFNNKPLNKGDFDRSLIERTLDQCLWNFYRYDDTNLSNKAGILGTLTVNLGLVQEKRFADGSKQKAPSGRYLNWTRGLDPNEGKFKDIRNRFIHDGILPAYHDLYDYFGYTLNNLLT
jgi:CheY-like chemotaxis protein